MKKKLMATFMAAALVVSMLAGCGSSEKTEQKTPDAEVNESADAGTDNGVSGDKTSNIDMSGVKLINDGVLTVGAEIGYPPFEDYAEDGTTPIGYDVDLAAAIADKLGLDYTFVNTGFDGILAGIGVNYDCVISAVTINPERLENALFSKPYIQNYQSVVVKKGSDAKINSLNDLAGLVIGVQKGTTSDILISDYKNTGTIDCTILANEQILSSFSQLDNGEINAVLCDSQVADGYIAGHPDKYELAYRDNSEPEEFGIAMGKEDTALQTAVNQAMDELKEEGFFEETANYWFGAQDSKKTQE